MAIGDILEGLLAGAAGGFRGYSEFQQAEALRKEREEERNRLERIRREDQAARAAEAAEARRFQLAVAGFTPSTEEEVMGQPIAARAPELGRLLEEFGPTQIAAPGAIPAPRTRSDIASALAADTDGGRMDSGAMVAPGQTYSAIDRALAGAEQPRPAPDRARVVMERGPEPQALRGPSARERGMDFLEVDDRFYTRPSERMLEEEAAAREAKRLEEQSERLSGLIVRAASGDRDALSEALAAGLGPQVEAYRDFGKKDVREPTGKAGEIDYLINVLGYEPDEAVNYVLERGADGMGGLSAGVQAMLFRMFEQGEPVMERDSSGELYDTGARRPYTEERKREIIQGYRELAKLMEGAGADAAQSGGGQDSRRVGFADFMTGDPFSADSRGTGERLMIGGGNASADIGALSPEQQRALRLGYEEK